MMYGLKDEAIAAIRGVFSQYPAVTRAAIFGSRALGTQRSNSDIDLALWGDIDLRLLGRIAGDLDELPLPFTFDVVVVEKIDSAALKEHIERDGREIFTREAQRT